MEEEGPALGVGFEIDFHDSFGRLKTLDELIGVSAANAVREFRKLEDASRGALNLGGATAELRGFGNAATRELAVAARELARVEKSGEALVRQLERQNSAFGRTREELRMMKAEAAAVAAEEKGLTELAARIRATESELAGKELAAARRARFAAEELAESRALAEAAAAKKALEDRTRAERMLVLQLGERAQLEAAISRNTGVGRGRATDAGATFSALAAKAAEEEAHAAELATLAQRRLAEEHARVAAAAREAAAQQAAFAADASALRAQLDPMFAAQQKFNAALDRAEDLFKAGAISEREYAAAQQLARDALRSHAASVTGSAKAVEQTAEAFNHSRFAGQQFAFQMSQVGQQVAAGTSAVQAFSMQLPDIAVGMGIAGNATNGFVRFLGGPWGIGLTTAAAVLTPFVLKLLEGNSALDDGVEKLRKDAAQTAATAAAKAEFERTLDGVVAAIREQNAALEKSIATSEQAEIQAYNEAVERRNNTVKIREQTVALLEQQKVLAENAKSKNIFAGGPGGAQSIVANQYAAEVERVQRDLETAKAAVAEAERGVRLAEIPRNQRAVAESMDAAAAATGRYERSLQKLNDQRAKGAISQREYIKLDREAQVVRDAAIKAAQEAGRKPRGASAEERRTERLGRESDATDALIAGLYKLADAYGVSDAAALKAQVAARAEEQGIRKQADVADYVAQQLRRATAEQVAAGAQAAADLAQQAKAQEFVNDAVRSGALDAEKASVALADMAQQRDLLTAINVAGANGDVQGYEAAKKALKALTDAQIADNKARREAEDLQKAAQINRAVADVQRETQLTRDLGAARLNALRGLSGDALEDELARIAAEYDKIAIQMRAEADAAREVALGHTEAAAAIMRKAEADKTQVDVSLDIERQTVAIERYNDHLRDTIDLFEGMGKLGKGLGAILGIITGDTSRIGGGLGRLLNTSFTVGQDENGVPITKSFGSELKEVFKKDGLFSKTMMSVLSAVQGAGIGMTAASALFGDQSGAQKIGSAIGGALGGSKVVKDALAGGLESISEGLGGIAGPLGSIAGGIIGSALGGLFSSVKWGRVNLSAGGVAAAGGNSGSSSKAALAAGNSIFGGLGDLASQFGGSIGDFGNISVGVRHGDYRVNAGGTSLKKKKGAVDFDQDAEAAVAYAMKLAIERGAITGIRQSTNNLLKAGDDLSAQINKALSFENVFAELKSYTDPVGAELDQIEKEFSGLRSIFAEAGASAEEYAQLEQLLTIKRQEAMSKEQDALDDIRSRIAEVQGDDATVKAIARARELKEATSDAQRAELQRLYALEDAKAAADALTEAQNAQTAAAEQLRQAWSSLGDDIMDEVRRIRGLTGGEFAASFSTLQGQFNAAVAAARGGDQAAAGRLTELSQALLESAGKTATSRQELERIKAETAAQLEGVYDSIGKITGSSASGSTDAALSAAAAAQAPASGETGTVDVLAELRALREEVAGARADNNTGHATTAGNTGKLVRKLDDLSAASGGSAISVTGAAA